MQSILCPIEVLSTCLHRISNFEFRIFEFFEFINPTKIISEMLPWAEAKKKTFCNKTSYLKEEEVCPFIVNQFTIVLKEVTYISCIVSLNNFGDLKHNTAKKNKEQNLHFLTKTQKTSKDFQTFQNNAWWSKGHDMHEESTEKLLWNIHYLSNSLPF